MTAAQERNVLSGNHRLSHQASKGTPTDFDIPFGKINKYKYTTITKP